MPQPPPSTTYQHLQHYVDERKLMSSIEQPLMLVELLGRSSPAPAQEVAQRILGSEKLSEAKSQGLAVANERTAIRS